MDREVWLDLMDLAEFETISVTDEGAITRVTFSGTEVSFLVDEDEAGVPIAVRADE